MRYNKLKKKQNLRKDTQNILDAFKFSFLPCELVSWYFTYFTAKKTNILVWVLYTI